MFIKCLLFEKFIALYGKSESFSLVSSNGYGYSSHYLYKLDDESIIVVNSGIDGIIHNIKKINPNFESNLRELLDFLKIDWSIYQNEKKDLEKKIEPACKYNGQELLSQ